MPARAQRKTLDAAELRQAAIRICSFVRCARLPLAPEVLRGLLDDACDLVVSRRQMAALCIALEAQQQLQRYAGRVPRYGTGSRAHCALDSAALTARVERELDSARRPPAPDFGRVASVFQLGRELQRQQRMASRTRASAR
jgi:hypothetical protein